MSGHVNENMTATAPLPVLTVTPTRDMIENKVKITVTGLPPRQPITLHAFLTSQKKDKWESWAHYVANDQGVVDVSVDSALGGTYTGVEPMGLFWSMQSTPDEMKGNRLRQYNVMKPRIIDIYVYIGHISKEFDKDKAVAMATVERWYIRPGVKRIPITERKVRGTLFLPSGPGPFPLIIDLWGGGGGIIEYKSSLFASHGFASIVLAYFNHPDLPTMGRLDMEYFEEAYDICCSYPEIDTDNVGVLGTSNGVSIALEIAAESKIKIKCAILTNGGLLRSYLTMLRFAQGILPPSSTMYKTIPKDEDGNLCPSHIYHVDDSYNDYGEDAFVRVKDLNCPCLFLVSGDDPSYEPEEHLQAIYQRLSNVGKQDLVEVLRYPKAGHLLEPPYAPLCALSYVNFADILNPKTDSRQTVYVKYGGQPKAHAEAQEHSWKAILLYFHKHLSKADSIQKSGSKL